MAETSQQPGQVVSVAGEPSLDPDALRKKYRAEREKRLRPDGNEQYVEVKGRFAGYLDDPYVEPLTRPPLTDEVDVAILGGGFGGLLVGARLREAGVEKIRIIEKGGDFGGTWYWNRYPGVQCDIESYIYLPLLEETGYVPKEKYSYGPEILAYARMLAEKFDLYREACFQTEVTALRWEEESARWIVATSRGDRIRARFVVTSSGPLNRPKLPGVPGIESFRGRAFHTSRWDYRYTGGDARGNLTGLVDKRVGIIGTGATAIQVVPHVGKSAKQLYVFQRTPSSVDVRNNEPTDPAWAASLEPGWQKRRRDNFNRLLLGRLEGEDLVRDNWTDLVRRLVLKIREGGDLAKAEIARLTELADFEKMEQIRARVGAVVEDVATAEALKPYYRQFCKRPCFHDDYLPTFNRPNVTLVDTRGRGVDRITEKGVVFDGVEYELDCLIFATGFEVGTSYTRRTNCEIHGRGGRTLSEYWANGMRSLHSFQSRGFPNLFFVTQAQGGLCTNFTHMLDESARHIAYVLRHAFESGIRTVEPSEEAEDEWVRTIVGLARMNAEFHRECTPGYYNNEGKPDDFNNQNAHYGKGSDRFFKLLADWRAEGLLRGLELTR